MKTSALSAPHAVDLGWLASVGVGAYVLAWRSAQYRAGSCL